MKKYVGIDLGGTFIKGGIVDDSGTILLQDKTPTESENIIEDKNKRREHFPPFVFYSSLPIHKVISHPKFIGLPLPSVPPPYTSAW